jgi:hypothetical protein
MIHPAGICSNTGMEPRVCFQANRETMDTKPYRSQKSVQFAFENFNPGSTWYTSGPCPRAETRVKKYETYYKHPPNAALQKFHCCWCCELGVLSWHKTWKLTPPLCHSSTMPKAHNLHYQNRLKIMHTSNNQAPPALSILSAHDGNILSELRFYEAQQCFWVEMLWQTQGNLIHATVSVQLDSSTLVFT